LPFFLKRAITIMSSFRHYRGILKIKTTRKTEMQFELKLSFIVVLFMGIPQGYILVPFLFKWRENASAYLV